MSIQDKINLIADSFGLNPDPIPSGNEGINSNLDFHTVDCTLLRSDNAIALSHILSSKKAFVDLCYIDPPYNTGNTFVYRDKREGERSCLFGSHAAWMTFMLPRLVLAHELISEDGFIAVSIDDNEQPYLRFLLDRIFGEENFVGNLVVCRSSNGTGKNRGIAVNHDYILVYSKSSQAQIQGLPADPAKYDKEDSHGRFMLEGLFRKKGDSSRREDRPSMYYPLYYDADGNVSAKRTHSDQKVAFPLDSKGVERRWLWGKEKAEQESWRLFASKSGIIYLKKYYSDDKRIKVKSLWNDSGYLTQTATKQIEAIFGDRVFETPKPVELIEDVIKSFSKKDAIILDFFAGTGTTAHAAFNLNRRDGGARKVILVEEEHPVQAGHLAFRHDFRTTADISEARLKYLSENDPSFVFSSVSL